jgi:uncharacterized protein (DUF486 family)
LCFTVPLLTEMEILLLLSWNVWKLRKECLFEYLKRVDANIMGSQELKKGQLDASMEYLRERYSYYGVGVKGEKLQVPFQPSLPVLVEALLQ